MGATEHGGTGSSYHSLGRRIMFFFNACTEQTGSILSLSILAVVWGLHWSVQEWAGESVPRARSVPVCSPACLSQLQVWRCSQALQDRAYSTLQEKPGWSPATHQINEVPMKFLLKHYFLAFILLHYLHYSLFILCILLCIILCIILWHFSGQVCFVAIINMVHVELGAMNQYKGIM